LITFVFEWLWQWQLAVAVGNWRWVAVAVGSGGGNWQLAIGNWQWRSERAKNERNRSTIDTPTATLCQEWLWLWQWLGGSLLKSGSGCVAVCSKVAYSGYAMWQWLQCVAVAAMWQWLLSGSGNVTVAMWQWQCDSLNKKKKNNNNNNNNNSILKFHPMAQKKKKNSSSKNFKFVFSKKKNLISNFSKPTQINQITPLPTKLAQFCSDFADSTGIRSATPALPNKSPVSECEKGLTAAGSQTRPVLGLAPVAGGLRSANRG
jgi:hypothetical protein